MSIVRRIARPGSMGPATGPFVLRGLALAILLGGVVGGFYSLGAWIADPAAVPSVLAGSRAERVRQALDEPDAITRYLTLANALTGTPREEIDAIVAVFEERLALLPLDQAELDLLGEAWAAFDPEGAIEHVMNTWPDEPRPIAIAAILRAWALRAPNAAFTWAETLDAPTRSTAIEAVFRGWAESGDSHVWPFLATLDPGWDRATATEIVAKSVAQNEGFEALLEQVAAIEPDDPPGNPRDFKLVALRAAIGLCAYYDPDRALAFARRFAGGPYDNNLLRRVAVFWAVKDGPAAMAAILRLPSEPQRDRALRDGYLKWLRAHGQAALDWMPADAADDERYWPLIDLYATALANKKTGDPIESIHAAARWADRIPDPEDRHAAAVRIGVEWLEREPDAAAAWIEERGLSADVEVAQRRRDRSDSSRRSRGKPRRAVRGS